MQKAILEEQIEPIALKLPAFPDSAKDTMVKIMPILAIISLVLGGLGLLGLLAFGIVAIFSLSAGITVLLAFLFVIISVILVALALPGLLSRKRAGWVWFYYAELVSIVGSAVNLNIAGVLIGLVWLYILFQVRDRYTESGTASA